MLFKDAELLFHVHEARDRGEWRAGCSECRRTGRPVRIVASCHVSEVGVGTCLVEEDILPVTALSREVFEVAVLVDAVLLAQLLPELAANCTGVSV